ncbi:hypothetical protein K501DRAFT_331283 [Backusella circina FSU 941]|nr:hypothetical protein K501DRAFT_331283 [Backusella circina FSU 941]
MEKAMQLDPEQVKSLRQRFLHYKKRNQDIEQKEREQEETRVMLEQQKKEEEAKLETERLALVNELQRVAQRQAFIQPQHPSHYFSAGFPTMVTEKEAIDWLRNGF